MTIMYIDTAGELATACQRLSASPFICVDTEFHRETTYYPQLALVQLANSEFTCCIDPLAISDLQPLLELLANANILKVFHAAYQDMEIFFHRFGVLPKPVFDTQIAAAITGYGDQIGYATLIKSLLNVDIDKTQTRTDWMQRPLSPQQIEYAGNDVFYLAQAYPMLHTQLEQMNRLHWLDEDFDEITRADTYQNHPEQMWQKVGAHQRLRGQQLAILQCVTAWREQTAQQRDKPRKRILPDDALIDIARLKPGSKQELQALRSLQRYTLSDNDSRAILDAIQQGQKLPKSEWPVIRFPQKLSVEDDAKVDILFAVLKLNAAQHNINPASIATRKQLEALVRGERDVPVLHGWRKAHGGQMMLDVLEGRLVLDIHSGKLTTHTATN
ncbi:MAG: ribonuclease D [Gammaproteobacteria bacterium]|nr:MAG: ribonuclease D [Gammaproteobacteria bacterium]